MDTQAADEDKQSVPCAWYFLPLPQPLGLPHLFQVREAEDLSDVLNQSLGSGLRTSAIVRQIQRTANPLYSDMVDISVAAARITGGLEPDADAQAEAAAAALDGTDPAIITVIEVAVPRTSSDSLDAGLDVALEVASRIQANVAAITQWGIPLINRSHLPPVIGVYIGALTPDGPRYDELVMLEVEGAAPPSSHGLEPTWLTDDQLRNLDIVADTFSRRQVFAPYSDLRREALTQLHVMGNTRTTVAMLATAGEVFVDALIQHLLWEEGADAGEVGRSSSLAEGHAHRIAVNLPDRLRGNWSTKGPGALAKYFENLVYLRHRVIHAGHRPSREEAKAAVAALVDLEHFVGDRLCHGKVLRRYTRTALAFLGDTGIKKRQAWTTAVRDLADDPAQPNWIDSFARWQVHVDRAAQPDPGPPGSDPKKVVVYVEVIQDGSCRWAAHDQESCHAVVFDPASYYPADRIAEAEQLTASVEDGIPRTAMWAPGLISGDWVPDHLVFQDLSISPGP